MNSNQIKHILKCNTTTRNHFSGVYSINTLKNIKTKPKLIICNTDPSYNPGKHWILFYFHDNIVDFFDPLGKKPEVYGKKFICFMKKYAAKYEICYTRTQPALSNLCGHYCIWYANMCCQKYTMSYIVNNLPSAVSIKYFAEQYLHNKYLCNTGQTCILF